jgi:hypothetical protein
MIAPRPCAKLGNWKKINVRAPSLFFHLPGSVAIIRYFSRRVCHQIFAKDENDSPVRDRRTAETYQ